MSFASSPRLASRAAVWGLALLACLGGAMLTWRSKQRESKPVLVHAPAVARLASPAADERCAQCHRETVEAMRGAPHLSTLTWAGDPRVIERFENATFRDEQRQADYDFLVKGGRLWGRSSEVAEPVRLDWIFGSGSHAQTPVSLSRNSRGEFVMLQYRLSWYPKAGLGFTLGSEENEDGANEGASGGTLARIGVEHLGDWQSSAETLACFGCHSERLNPDDLAQPQGVQAGLGCTRCHVNAAAHASNKESGEAGPALLAWSQLAARQHVDRCGECHRRADQTPVDEITPEAEHIVRFAPVGLVQSKCFTGSEKVDSMRMDCLTCHDPHRPAARDAGFYAAKCRECHDSRRVAVCSERPGSDQCTACHMPKRETQRFLFFTDHWIRRNP